MGNISNVHKIKYYIKWQVRNMGHTHLLFYLKRKDKLMLKNYFRMLKNKWKIKAMVYDVAANVIDNHKDILELAQNLFISLKDVPLEQLHEEFIMQLAEIIHRENEKKTN